MRIIELQMKNFGKFSDKNVLFHEGINIIYGSNEMGKTTMHSFLKGMFFGIDKQRGRASKNDEYTLREPWNNRSFYAGILRFESGGKIFRLERSFHKSDKSAELVCETDGERLSIVQGDLEPLMEGLNETAFRNTVFVSQKGVQTDAGLAIEIQNYMANIQNTGDSDIDVGLAVKCLNARRKTLESEKKRKVQLATGQMQEVRMKIDYIRQELQVLQEEKQDCSIQKERIEQERCILQQEYRKNTQKESNEKEFPKAKKKEQEYKLHENVAAYIQRRQQFLVLLLGLAALFVCIFVPAFWIKGFTLLGWLLLSAICIYRQKRRTQQIHDDSQQGIDRDQGETSADSNDLEEELRQIREAEQKLQWKLEQIQENIKEKGIIQGNLTETLEELQAGCAADGQQELETKALRLAGDIIQEIADGIYKDSAARLNETISCILAEITDGAYTSVFLDANMEVRINTPDKLLTLEQVSRGTMDQIYFALRMAAGEMLCRQEHMPILLDDAFAMYDDRRLAQTLRWMFRSGRQVILFTCHKREAEILQKISGGC